MTSGNDAFAFFVACRGVRLNARTERTKRCWMKKINRYTSNLIMKGGVAIVSLVVWDTSGDDDDDPEDYPGPFGVE